MSYLSEILDEIDKIDWAVLHYAYGAASDVPALLRGLVSEHDKVRLTSLYRLCETIWHQGTVYEASPHAVPILLEMLKSSEVNGKSGIALLVAELADGNSSLELYTDNGDEISRLFKGYLKQEGRDFEEQLKNERYYIQATRKAVGLEIDSLFEYMKDEEPEVRESIARALARFPYKIQESIAILEDARAIETEDYVAKTMDTAIAKLKNHL